MKLVAIENALKDYAPYFCHDVPTKIKNFGATQSNSSFYNVMSSNIGTGISRIKVNAKPSSGSLTSWYECPMFAPRSNYPYIRYTRFDSDYASDYTNESHISDLNRYLTKVVAELKRAGKI